MSGGEPFREVWVELDDGQAMCALINGDRGWLTYQREIGDEGFHSVNPAYDGPPDAAIDYRLDNGQMDEYPAAWAVPLADIERALAFFRREQRPPGFINWHNDSEDGQTL
jgi:hypothetical protein